MRQPKYLMEGKDEALRLDLKTDPRALRRQARWAGVRPGMRVGDFGCGPGKTSFTLNRLVQPGGEVLGIDISPARISYARERYSAPGIEYVCADIRKPLALYGMFDFIWVRFVLEHCRSSSAEIVANIAKALKPGGILCLADLDHNCLSHYGLSPRLEQALHGIMARLERGADFDPYAGRRLYAYLYDLGLTDIKVTLYPHHLIYGPAKKSDLFNWNQKVEIAARNSGYEFNEFPGGYEGFLAEFRSFFNDHRRFTYSPLICCRGRRPG
ncbi:MAG: class I SAM-dependent methyltransferase [Desulfobacterales bacterium]